MGLIEDEFSNLLTKKWTEDEMKMIKRIMDGITYYRKLMPKGLKDDVIAALQLCNKLKIELEEFAVSCDCKKLEELEPKPDVEEL